MGTVVLLVVCPPLKKVSAVYVTPSIVSVPPPALIALVRVNPPPEELLELDEVVLPPVEPELEELLELELLEELELLVVVMATLSLVEANVNLARMGKLTEFATLRNSIVIAPVLVIPAIDRLMALLRLPAVRKIS